MTRDRKPYIAGNWKMNLDRARALDLIKTIKGRLGDGSDREVAVFAPSVLPGRRVRGGSGIAARCIGAQNLSLTRPRARSPARSRPGRCCARSAPTAC